MTRFAMISILILLPAIAAAQIVSFPENVPAANGMKALEPAIDAPASTAAGTTVMMQYHNTALPRFNWQMPNNYGSFINLFMLQRFSLPNNAGFLDSIQVFITDISTGAISFRVYPAEMQSAGSSTFWFPVFTAAALDSLFIDKSQLKMNAWNSIKFNGSLVPKEFFISVEFTISGGSNNTIVIPGDFHELTGRTMERTRVIMLNSAAGSLQMRTLDSTLVESGTQKPIYSYLYMTAFADTATSNDIPEIITTPITTGYANLQYKYDMHAASNPRSVYKLLQGPAGLYLEWYTGEMTWVPSDNQVGQHTVSVEAFNTNGKDTQTWTINVVQPTAPKITSFPRKMALVGEPYFYQVTATGGPAPTYSITSTLQGLTMDPATGRVQMTPTAGQVGQHIVGVTARNPVGQDDQSFILRIDATPSAPTITSTALTTAKINQPYRYQVEAGGNPQASFSLLQSPAGMTIDAVSGQIEWTPAAVGVVNVGVRAENRVGSADQSFSITVGAAATPPVFTFAPRTLAVAGQQFTDTVSATGDPEPKYFLITNPYGMSIDSLRGIITWMPSRDDEGDNSVVMQARNSAGAVDYPYTITVHTSPRITSSQVFVAYVDQEYRYQAVAEGYPAPAWSFTKAPQGMTVVENSGLVTWTPTAAQKGRHDVVLVATNTVGSAQQQYSVTVSDPAPAQDVPEPRFAITDVYPNPMDRSISGEAVCAYEVAAAGRVVIEIRDMLGRVAAVLSDAEQAPGRYSLTFDSSVLSAGSYIISLRGGNGAALSRPLTILR